MSPLRRAMDSSAVVRGWRRVASSSTVWALLSAATRWPNLAERLRETRRRIAIGAGGDWSGQQEIRTVEQLDVLASSSLLVAGAAWLVTRPILAWRESALRRAWGRASGLDVVTQIRTASVAIVVAVLCHTALLAVLGVHVQALGWSTRAGLLAAGVLALRYPETLAAAWRDKLTS